MNAISKIRHALMCALYEIAKDEEAAGVIFVQNIDTYVIEKFEAWYAAGGDKTINNLVDSVT